MFCEQPLVNFEKHFFLLWSVNIPTLHVWPPGEPGSYRLIPGIKHLKTVMFVNKTKYFQFNTRWSNVLVFICTFSHNNPRTEKHQDDDITTVCSWKTPVSLQSPPPGQLTAAPIGCRATSDTRGGEKHGDGCRLCVFHPHVRLIVPAVTVETEVWHRACWVIRVS